MARETIRLPHPPPMRLWDDAAHMFRRSGCTPAVHPAAVRRRSCSNCCRDSAGMFVRLRSSSRVILSRSIIWRSAWPRTLRGIVSAAARSRTVRSGLVTLHPRARTISLSGRSAKCSVRTPGVRLLRRKCAGTVMCSFFSGITFHVR